MASYIVHGDEHVSKATLIKMALSVCHFNLYANLSHDFIKELGFNLKNILPHRKLSLHNFLHSVNQHPFKRAAEK